MGVRVSEICGQMQKALLIESGIHFVVFRLWDDIERYECLEYSPVIKIRIHSCGKMSVTTKFAREILIITVYFGEETIKRKLFYLYKRHRT